MPSPRGQNPIDDVVYHAVDVLSREADALIAEIVALGGRQTIEDRYRLFYRDGVQFIPGLDSLVPLPNDLVGELQVLRDELEAERRMGGWEVDRLLAEAHERRRRAEP